MKTPVLVISGSARKDGNTTFAIKTVFKDYNYIQQDLSDYTVYPYNYSGSYPEDDEFYRLTDLIITAQTIVFATPVYWYSMSGLMKIFFDRFTDLVTTRKETGRKLKGKRIFLLATGTEPELPEGFEVPFRSTSDYLDMHYHGAYYLRTGTDYLKAESESTFLNEIFN